MATPQLSPGILTREVDLTVGRADNVLDNIGAIAAPFAIGPVEQPIRIRTERDLINVFGKPSLKDAQYEYWMSASSFLSYGGVLSVVRINGDNLVNANGSRDESVATTLNIKNFDNYNQEHYEDTDWGFAAKNPGSWANDLKVCMIDDKADQILSGISTNSVTTTTFVGLATVSNGDVGIGTTIITGISTNGAGNVIVVGQTLKTLTGIIDSETTVSSIGVGTVYLSKPTLNTVALDNVRFDFGSYNTTTITQAVEVGYGVTQDLSGKVAPGLGVTSVLDGYLKGIVTGIGEESIEVKVTSYVSAMGDETPVNYQQKGVYSFSNSGEVSFHDNSETPYGTAAYTAQTDWYDEQTLGLTNSATIYWKSIAPKPITTRYSLERNGKNDAVHIAIVDDTGKITGNSGTLLEKFTSLSKAKDAISAENSPQKIFWKDYIAIYSAYAYAGSNPSDGNHGAVAASGFSSGFIGISTSAGEWNSEAQDVTYGVVGNVTFTLTGGKDYGNNKGMAAELGNLITGYELFSNEDEIALDYLIMGPGLIDKSESQAKANYLISVAEKRKDCMAVISPHRADVVNLTNTEDQTNNIIEFFSPLQSSSYAVFDSGYKYTYDRFNNRFCYIPCNPDVAGLMVRTSITSYPWFSPAGQQRGVLNNAIKLAYTPNKDQRDRLYTQRVNSIINQPGNGVLLFGDKTALGYASAFDRINVRRLFLTIEQALKKTAQAQLFEINDEFTRAAFVNIVDPYLRDVRAKRGLYNYLVVADATVNTPDVIDNNEFRANIFLQPTKSINYVTLTFVATRTGISFSEVAGSV